MVTCTTSCRTILFLGFLIIAGCGSALAQGATNSTSRTDDDVRQAIIRQSIAEYSGPCPCPYNVMRNGRSCGGNSAYSRPGGKSPLCYPKDVSDEMVRHYRAQRR
jgi:hypothetical protein